MSMKPDMPTLVSHFHSAIDRMRECNAFHRQDVPQRILDKMDVVDYLYQHGTVRMGIGSCSGKSEYIKKQLAKDYPTVVITAEYYNLDKYKDISPNDVVYGLGITEYPFPASRELPKLVILEEPTTISKHTPIKTIYEIFGQNYGQTFLLLGN